MNKHAWLRCLGRVPGLSVQFTFFVATLAVASAGEKISDRALRQIEALQAEKASRSAVHRKLDSQFVFALKRQRGQAIAAEATQLRADTNREADGRFLV